MLKVDSIAKIGQKIVVSRARVTKTQSDIRSV